MTHFVVDLELAHKPDAAFVGRAMDHLADWHAAVGAGPVATSTSATITVPAEGLRQAVAQGLALVDRLASVVAVAAVSERVRDGRQGWASAPERLGVTEAAAALGLSRQRVLQMIAEGKLPAEKVGSRWLVPAGAVTRPAG